MTFKWRAKLLVVFVAAVTGCTSLDTLRNSWALSKNADMQSEKSLLNFAVAAVYGDFDKIRKCLSNSTAEKPKKVKGKYKVSDGVLSLVEIIPLNSSQGNELLASCAAGVIGREKDNFSAGLNYNPRFLKRTFEFSFTGTILPLTEGIMVSDKYQFSEAFKD